MDKTGLDPDRVGVKSEQEGLAYIERMNQLQNYYLQKKARGGYTLQEELLLKRYANR